MWPTECVDTAEGEELGHRRWFVGEENLVANKQRGKNYGPNWKHLFLKSLITEPSTNFQTPGKLFLPTRSLSYIQLNSCLDQVFPFYYCCYHPVLSCIFHTSEQYIYSCNLSISDLFSFLSWLSSILFFQCLDPTLSITRFNLTSSSKRRKINFVLLSHTAVCFKLILYSSPWH